jgi:hypothetical protein
VPGAPSTPGIRRGGSTVACGSDPSVSIMRPNRCQGPNRCQAPAQGRAPGIRRGGSTVAWGSDPSVSIMRPNRCCGQIGARHLPRTRRDASNLRPGLEVGARHLPKTRSLGLRPERIDNAGNRCQECWKSVPGTCQGRAPGTRRGGSTVAWGSDPSVSIRRPNRCQAPAKDARQASDAADPL